MSKKIAILLSMVILFFVGVSIKPKSVAQAQQGCSFVVANNGFEFGEFPWVFGGKTEFSPTPPPYNGLTRLENFGFTASSGVGNALLQPNRNPVVGTIHISTIYQPIIIPFGTSSGNLTFRLRVNSSAPSNEFDTLQAGLGPSGPSGVGAFYGGFVRSFAGSSQNSGGYTQVSVPLGNMSSLAGQTVHLQFLALPNFNNTTGRTVFRVDDVCLSLF